jgi:DNA ligase-1
MSELSRVTTPVYDDISDRVKQEGSVLNILKLYSICEQLKNTSSTIEKQNILKQNEHIKSFKEILKFLLDSMVVTGISQKKINKDVRVVYYEEESRDYWLEDLLEYISKNNTGRDMDIAFCQFYISKLTNDENLQDFIKSIIAKSLKLGIDIKTVNKVYGKNFIPKLDVMLGTSVEKCKIPEGTWFSISQKLNGSRCFYYKGELYTRQGKVYTGCEHIITDIETVFPTKESGADGFVFDGELVLKDNSLSDSEAFQKGVGIANSDKENKEELKLVIFDVVPTSEFENGMSSFTYKDRKQMLQTYRKVFDVNGLNNIEIVPMFYAGTNQNEIWKWLDYAEANDMEGIMLNLDTPYECKRTKNLIKVKKFFDIDLCCTGVEKGSGKYSNTLGAIICDYKGNELRVGSGFSDEQRDYYWNNPNEIIGKTVTIKYKEETKNKNGGQSLQFPVWVTTRFDK